MKPIYRLWQFLVSLFVLVTPLEEAEARRLLSPTEYALFRKMARYDRAHALRVLRRLRERGVDDPTLLKAALLHDAGKSAGGEGIPLLYRGPIVLIAGGGPVTGQQLRSPPCHWQSALWVWLARERPRGDPRRPFYLHAVHAIRGAALARQANCAEEVVALIAAHHDEEATGTVRLLQEADDRA